MSNQVVSMSTEKPKPVEEIEVPAKKKLFTNWKAFDQAGLGVKNIRCDGYTPIHPYNNGCHTNIIPTTENLAPHIDGEHGGGFEMALINEGNPSPLWKELEADGVEIRDIRCGHCGAEVRLHPKKLQEHGWKSHPGKFSKTAPAGVFAVTFTRETPLQLDDEVN